MSTVRFDQLYNGESNQPPFRVQPGQVRIASNFRLEVAEGAIVRNGTRFLANLAGTFSSNNNNIYWTSFGDDIIAIQSGRILCYNAITGAAETVNQPGGADAITYITDSAAEAAGTFASLIDTTTIRDSLVVLNRNKVTGSLTSASYTPEHSASYYVDMVLNIAGTQGQRCLVKLPYALAQAGYYQLMNQPGSNIAPDWRLIAAPGQTSAIPDRKTLPVALTRLTDSTFTLNTIPYSSRLSGTPDSNPLPPFFGKTVEAICAHSNRLFFFSGGTISSTQSDDKYSFYIGNIDVASDPSSPIVADVNNTNVGKALFIHSVNGVLFSVFEKGQIVFTSGTEQLSNINGVDVQVGDFVVSNNIESSSASSSVVLMDRNNIVHEFVASPTPPGMVYGGPLNAHAPKVLEGETVTKIVRIDTTTFFLTAGGTVFVHEKRIDKGDLVQTGWSRMDFGAVVLHISQHNGELRLVVRNSNGTISLLSYVHRYQIKPVNYAVAPRLDYSVDATGTYDGSRDVTVFTYAFASANTRVALPDGRMYTPVRFYSNVVEVAGSITGTVTIGNTFQSNLELIEFYAGTRTVIPTVSTLTVYFADAKTFKLTANRAGTNDSVEVRYSRPVSGDALFSDTNVATGSETFLVGLDGRDAKITVSVDSGTPATISALEFELRFGGRVR